MRGKTPDVYRRRIEEDSHDPSVCGWAMRICIMKTAIRNSIHKLWDFFADDNLNISKWDGALLGDFYSYNLSFCITAAAMLCVLSLIGLIGTYAPFSTGLIIPAINATVVYLIIFGTNACFLAALQYAHIHQKTMPKKRLKRLFVWFTGINMILASATFFTTQKDSSFFFEYILITIIIDLIPIAGTFSFFRNMVINVVSVIFVLAAADHPIAWQDVVDIVALQVICGFVNRSRLQNFRRREQAKLSIEKQKEKFYHDSRTDELTRLENRMALRSDFASFLNHPVCVALIDLDFFKKYNDTYGHAYGDQVLATAGNYFHQIFHEENDHCYRYGGDEFLILSENEEADVFRKKLGAFQELCGTKKGNVEIECSIGYYADTAHTETALRSIIKRADTYLYQSKAEGTGHINGGVHEANPEEDSTSRESGNLAASSASGLDPLTGLINMRTFLAVMRQWRQEKRDVQADGELAVLYFDVINFRIVNLLYGMTYGDERLRSMGKILQNSFQEGVVSHWDVDHFVVLTDTRNLDRRAEDVIKQINSTLPASTECSVGVSVWKDHQLDEETLCNQARTASDEGRKKVGIHFSYYTDEMGKTLDIAAYVVSHIDEAVEQGWIVPYYQPIIRALSNRICGMEALARWKDPAKGILPPADFINPLEDARLIYKLDLSVIRQAVKQIADRYSRNLPEIPLSINLSKLDFLCCNIYQEIENLVMEYDIPRRMLHIEVTESIMTSEEDAVLKALQSFRNAGYELWMDDFGSGYSTLNLLKDYSFDLLKLDMGFLRSDSPRSRSIIGSVIEMDKKLGIRTLAEGVETEEQVQYLKKSGCEKLQGYYFGRPMPFEEALQNCLDKGIGVESAKQKICYDALGHVNFMTDIPMIISEMTGDRTHLLFANDHGLRQCRKDGFRDLAALEENLNDRGNIVSRKLLAAGQHVKAANDTSEMVVFFNGKRRLLRYQLLGSYDDTRLFVTYIYDGSSEDNDPEIGLLLEQMPIGCYILKPDHTVLYWNPAAESILGFSSKEMLGKKCIDMPLGCSFTSGQNISGQNCPAVIAYRTGRPYSLRMFMRKKDGSDVLVYNTLMPAKDKEGKVTKLISLFFALADKDYDASMIQSMYEIATRDPLTCLPGRKYMEACLQEELERFRRTGNSFAVLFADADYLHEINNTYGHEAGDALLKELGLALRHYGRSADRFCRWGGDEFVGLLQLKNPGDIEGAAQRLKRVAEKCEIEFHGQKISCQSAIGITVVRDGDDAKSLIKRADRYMFEAKKLTDKQIVTDANAGSVSQNPDEDAGEKPKEIKTEEQRENS